MAQQVVVIEPDYFSVEVTAPQTVTISNTGPQGPEGGTSTLTTKGDILGRSATAVARIPVGTDGQMLTADSTNPLGVAWTTPNPGDITGVTVSAPITGGGTSGTVNIGLDQGSITIAQSQVTNLVTDLAAKAPLASPTFTGDPKAPTPTSTDNDTSIATTAFVQAQKASPALTGTPTAPTAPLTTSTTQIATTEFVDEGTVDIRQFAADKSVLDNLPARIHPAEQLLKQAVFWIDSAHSSASGQTITNLGWGGSALNATAGSTGSADSNDPKFLSWDGTNYVYLPGGSTGNTLTVPNETALQITGDLDIRAYVSMDSWTPSGRMYFVSKDSSSYSFAINAAKTLRFIFSGTNGRTVDTTATVPFADNAAGWVRVTLDVDNGSSGNTIVFYTSTDGVTWTTLETSTAAGVATVSTNTSTLFVGALNGGPGTLFTGRVYRAIVKNGIDGTPVLDVDTSLVTSGSNTSFTALTGQTVTINRSTSGRKTVAVTSPCYLLGTDDYIEVNNRWVDGTTKNVYLPGVAGNYLSAPDSAALDITGDIDVRVKVAMDDWTPAANSTFAGKWTAASSSWYFGIGTTGLPALVWSPDNVITRSATATVAPTVTNGSTLWIRAALDVDNGASQYAVMFYTSTDGSTWTQLGSTVTGTTGVTSIFNSTAGLTVGAHNAGSNQPSAGRFYRAVIYSDLTETTKVFDANMETSITSLTQTTFTESSSNAATVTINKSGTGYVSTPIVQSGYIYPTGTSNLTPSTSSLLDFGATESFTIMAAVRQFGTNPDQAIIAKTANATSTMVGYIIYNNVNTQTSDRIGDGTTRNIPGDGTVFTLGAINVRSLVRNTANDTVASFVNGAGTSITDTTTGSLSNSDPLRIGRLSTGGTAYLSGEIFAAAVFRRALTTAEITTISNYFAGRAA